MTTPITDPRDFDVLLTAEEVASRVGILADQLVPRLRGKEWTAIVILLGATPFAADLLRALAERGVDVGFDALWLTSYRDGREAGRLNVRVDIQRSVKDRGVLIVDDVFDTGNTMAFAKRHLLAKGASEAISAVFARKPDAVETGLDFWAYEAPPRYLVGYGMDDAGKWRGLPFLGALPNS